MDFPFPLCNGWRQWGTRWNTRHCGSLNDVNGTRPACGSVTRERSIDRRVRVRVSWFHLDALVHRVRVTGLDRVFVAEFEVAGSSFVGRSLADSRHAATLLLFLCRGRDVSCVDFVSIIHPDYRPEPIRAAILYSARLLRSDGGQIWLLTRVFLERIPNIAWFRGLSIIFDRSSRYLSLFKVIFKSVSRVTSRDKSNEQQKVSFEKLISRPTISYSCYLIDIFQDIEYSIEILLHAWI